ncbi:hypothetical protein [Mycolicibacterium pyrenivorans]|uniref:hypothetical protein n=1 Tax=Mycolicibacterium pyrenivorans TaxID=187102 RepID=UPI0021F2CE16|nr:hypothetical protein [Mycolicibacterium pyrenivorans]
MLNGTAPAQAPAATSSSGSSGQPPLTFSDQLSSPIASRNAMVAASSLRLLGRSSATRPGMKVSVRASRYAAFCSAPTTSNVPKTTALR